MKTISQR